MQPRMVSESIPRTYSIMYNGYLPFSIFSPQQQGANSTDINAISTGLWSMLQRDMLACSAGRLLRGGLGILLVHVRLESGDGGAHDVPP